MTRFVIHAVLAASISGVIELVWLAFHAQDVSPLAWLICFALTCASSLVTCALVQLGVSVVLRVPRVADWHARFVAGGAGRVTIAWRGLLIVVGTVSFGVAAAWLSTRLHDTFRFQDAKRVGAMLACVVTPLAAATTLILVVIDRRVMPRLARSPHLLEGSRRWFVLVPAMLLLVGGPWLLADRVIPEANVAPVVIGMGMITAAIGARLAAPTLRPMFVPIASGLVVAIVAGSFSMGHSESARATVVAHGVLSKVAAKLIWKLADRDGDRYAPSWIGGADCDDSDAKRSPGRRDILDNGVDENCTGADARSAPAPSADGPRSAAPTNVVLISVDTLRADHLGAWGYARPTSPEIDRFAHAAVRFDWAMTTAPSTRYAIPSMLTGRYASALETPTPTPSLAEALREAGWETAAVLCCRDLVRSSTLRGFATVDSRPEMVRLSRPGQSNGDAVTDAAIEWIARAGRSPGRPFFLWAHFYDPHHPYVAPAGSPSFGDSDLDRYDAEITYSDRSIGRLLRSIDELGLRDRTIVILTSDHGEEFGEHGIRFHARTLYNQVTRVPLVIRAPRSVVTVVDVPVSIADIMPTVLALVGVPAPAMMNGVSLANTVLGVTPAPERPVLMELVSESWYKRDAVAIVTREWKVIWDREANSWHLYAHADSADDDDLAAARPQVLAEMRRLLEATLDRDLAIQQK